VSTALPGAAAVPREHDFAERLAGKYLTFKLAGREYGIDVVSVRGIVGAGEIAWSRRSRELVRGVVHLRGGDAPVLDLRRVLGVRAGDATAVVLVQLAVAHRRALVGMLVDEVAEVLSICEAQIAPPARDAPAPPAFVPGVAQIGDRVVFLVDVGGTLGGDGAGALAVAA
jgi:purine-binding chemotaxis protein CheW